MIRLLRLLVLVICCWPLWAYSLTSVKVALDWYVNPDHAPLLVAKAKGFFRAHGLKVQFISPAMRAQPDKLLAAKQVDFALTYQPALLRDIAARMPIAWAGNIFPQPMTALAVLQSSDIKKISDLKGRLVGVAPGGSRFVLDQMLQQSGLTEQDIRLVTVNMGLSQALLAHRVAAVFGIMRNVEPVQLADMGFNLRLFYPEAFAVPNYAELVIATDQNMSATTVSSFIQAVQQGVDDLRRHPKQDWQLARQSYPQALAFDQKSAVLNKSIWLATIPYFAHKVGYFNADSYHAFNNFMVDHGQLASLVPASRFTALAN